MTTGKRHVLLSRNVGLGQKRKPPVYVKAVSWDTDLSSLPHSSGKEEPPTGNWGTVTLPETSTSFKKLFYTGKTIAVKMKGVHVPWWEEKHATVQLANILDSTQIVSTDLLFPPCAGLMSTLLAARWRPEELCLSAPFTAFHWVTAESLGCLTLRMV